MYIGGTDENALHHLAAEIIDNAMDEAVAGHADRIEVSLEPGNWLSVRDNGRGIPTDPHPRFPKLSALEVIFTTLHSGGKFSGKAYETSGGLHGVGSSVVNALSERLEVEVARDRTLWTQAFERGKPVGKLKNAGSVHNRRGTTVRFRPDPEIFGKPEFSPARLYRLCRSKAYLFRGVEIRWSCDPSLVKDETPPSAVLHFPGGLSDFLQSAIEGRSGVVPAPFTGEAEFPERAGRCEEHVGEAGAVDPHHGLRPGEQRRLLVERQFLQPDGDEAAPRRDLPAFDVSAARYELNMAFSRGLYTGWFKGIHNQELAHGRFGTTGHAPVQRRMVPSRRVRLKGGREAAVGNLIADAMRAAVGADGRDAHLRHDLEQTLVERAEDVGHHGDGRGGDGRAERVVEHGPQVLFELAGACTVHAPVAGIVRPGSQFVDQNRAIAGDEHLHRQHADELERLGDPAGDPPGFVRDLRRHGGGCDGLV